MKIPKHIAIIMDGNGRWAKKRLMPRFFGHTKGMERMVGLLDHAFDLGVDYVTVYALSTENLKRPKEELEGLFNLIRKHFVEYMKRVIARGVRLRVIGDISLLPLDVQEILRSCEKESERFTGKGINMALCYGSRAEIVRGVNEAVKRGECVTEESFSSLLDTHGEPDPDLLIRTGNEVRLSNFLLWQSAYAELYFTDVLWPDFKKENAVEALLWYQSRNRRFGKV